MTPENKRKYSAIFVGVAGWVIAVALVLNFGALRVRAASAEADAANWKRQAGKAYTEMLNAKAGAETPGGSKVAALVPKGARIDCTMKSETRDGQTVSTCVDGVIYPPSDY